MLHKKFTVSPYILQQQVHEALNPLNGQWGWIGRTMVEDMDHTLSASLRVWRFVFVRNLAVSKWSDLIILLPAVTFSRSKLTNSSHIPDQKIK